MKIKKFYSLFFFVFLFNAGCHSKNENTTKAFTQYKIGEPFYLDHIVDTTGIEVSPDFSKAEINVIDIWNNSCPPCLEEMKQFPGIVSKKKTKIHIYSLSLTQFWLWQKTVKEHTGAFSFLASSYPFWNQYNLMTTADAGLKNQISADRFQELDKLYHTKGNPEYFIINKKGLIIDRPESAVSYLKGLE